MDKVQNVCAAIIQEDWHDFDFRGFLDHEDQLLHAGDGGPKAGRQHWNGYSAVLDSSCHFLPPMLTCFKAAFVHKGAVPCLLELLMEAADKCLLDIGLRLLVKPTVADEDIIDLLRLACMSSDEYMSAHVCCLARYYSRRSRSRGLLPQCTTGCTIQHSIDLTPCASATSRWQ